MFIYKINLSDQPSSSPKLIPYFQSPVCNYSTFVTIGTKLFCIGGVWEGRKKFYKDFGVSECSPVVVSLDTRVVTSDRHWIRLRRMHLPRRCPKVVVIDSKIYVFGGINVSSSCSGFAHFVKCWAEVYDPKFNTWARLRTSTHQSLFSSLSPSGATFPFIIATFSHQKILIVTCGGRELTKTFLYDIVSGLLEPKDVFESGGVFNRFSPPYHPGPALTLGNSIYTVDWLRGTVQGYSLVSSRWTNTKHQFISNHEYDVEDNRARNHILVSAHNVSPPSTVVDPGLGDGGDQLHILYMVRGPYGSRSRYIYHKKMEVSHDHMGGTLTLSNLSCPTVYSIRSGWRCAILGACCCKFFLIFLFLFFCFSMLLVNAYYKRCISFYSMCILHYNV